MSMGRKYATSGTLTAPTSATAPISNIISTTAIRPMIYDIVVGSTATPADNAARFQIQRCTTAGTTPTTTITPTALDPGDPASTATSFQGSFATNPTLTSNLFLLNWSQNQRATFRWVAAPNSELVAPATASNGLALVNPAVGNSAVAYEWIFLFAE